MPPKKYLEVYFDVLSVCYRERVTNLSLTGKQWILPETPAHTDVQAMIDVLEGQRNIERIGAGELPDSFGEDIRRYRDFPAARDRLLQAMESKEKIGIFGDYDCDGITSTSILVRFFRRRGINPIARLPHRLREGYGLRPSIVEEFRNAGVTLLITVDTGVTSEKEIAAAKKAGIDTIVLDHHRLPDTLPSAVAILHPALASPESPAHPCGAGVTWAFVRGMEEHLGNHEWEDQETDIALAAMGTVADLVELRAGNRTLVHRGLMALQMLTHGPLPFLCLHAGLKAPYTSRDIAFRLAPRINAAGRMADPHTALHALLGDEPSLLELDALNGQRQDVMQELIESLLPEAERETSLFLSFARQEFSPGICGLLAGKLTERFGKPSLVASIDGEGCVASLRSVPGYNVTLGLKSCADLLTSFGGHAMAAGCSFKKNCFAELHARLNDDVRSVIGTTPLQPTLYADLELHPQSITLELCSALSTLEPFGQGNPEPRFLLRNVTLRDAKRVGGTKTHLQASLQGRKLIGFQLGHLEEHTNKPLDLLCKIGVDSWRGALAPQLFLEDMRVSRPEPVSPPSQTPLRREHSVRKKS